MTNWSEMRPAEFDRSGLSKRERQVVTSAAGTLFPELMPEAKHATPAPAACPLGTGDLLELISEGDA
jgi:hypothetical protein